MNLLKPKINWEADYSSKILVLLVFFVVFVFGVRLWFLQILKGEYFAKKSLDNRTRIVKVYAPRGLILDREKKLLAFNEPAYDLAIIREDCKDKDCKEELDSISILLKKDLTELKEKFFTGKKRVKVFEPLILSTNLSFPELAKIESRLYKWPALKIVVRPRRKYNYAYALSHVLGYVSLASEEDLSNDLNLDPGDYIGKSGIEKSYEDILRGKKGKKKLEIDAVGRVFKESLIELPQPGKDLFLSIDLELQNYIYHLLEGKAGAVVVLEPETGQILALVSSPGYDLNRFVFGVKEKEWKSWLKHPFHPLQNKVIQGTYPPGSVFKLVMAGFFLNRLSLDPLESVFCSGDYKLGLRVFRCWRKEGHGWVNLKRALVESCDVYFYKQGEGLDIDELKSFVVASGFSRLTLIDLPYEKAGFFPSKEWKRKRFREGWQKGENLNISIGQGYVLVTPLQVAKFVAGIVNNGITYKPSLLLKEKKMFPETLPFSQKSLEFIRRAMIETVENDRGTARSLKERGIVIGAKTGTAQVVKLKEEDLEKEVEEIPYKYRDHAWMASFGVINQKKYVVVCLMEHGGHGASGSGPIVKKIYTYLKQKNDR
ncbi:MAG: Penicillin-binding protein 2 [Desulfonauticus sp. 38_4375]|nr:MAG: Penicillin-binding protein 2 [Desulfonauticus sp. 38_4375]